MVAHNCHGKTKNLTAKAKYLTAKPKASRQNQILHSKSKIALVLPWVFAFAVRYLVFAVKSLVLPWGFWFCREVFGFAVRYLVFAVKYLVLPWGFRFCREIFCFCREVFGFAVTVAGHRRTEWSPIRSVIIRVINKISPISLITSMVTDLIGRREVLLTINHNFNKICDI